MYYEVIDTNIRILGSMHMIPADAETMPDWVFKAYEWSESLVFESDPSTILSHVVEKESSSWHKLLSPSSFASLKRQWPSNGNFPEIETVFPWAAMLFSSVFSSCVSDGVEPHFLRMAAENSKPVQFLETAEAVAEIFSSIQTNEIIKNLENLAADLSAPQRNLASMYKAWIKKDISQLCDIASKADALQNPAIRQAVLNTRNLAWLPALQELMKTPRKTLIAVGALHLHGSGSIIELLKRNVRCI